jgi:hypothetical protein
VLGSKRPDAVAGIVAAIEDRLDAARRLQLERDRWALRAPAFEHYQADVAAPLNLFTQLQPALESIKALSGSTPGALRFVERTAANILKLVGQIVPPQELSAAHALFVSAAQLSMNAAQIRREAALAGDMARAWNASSAAAGALMLAARARTDMQTIVRPPQLR